MRSAPSFLALALSLGCHQGDEKAPSVAKDSGGETGAHDSHDSSGGDDDSATESTPPDDSAPDTDHTGDTEDSNPPAPSPPAVILMIGDGMGFEHVRGGGLFANGATGSLVMETLPYQGRIRTASMTGVTDSAAAATTLGSGYKTWNGWLGLDTNEVEVESILRLAASMDMGTGVVTTDTLTGATPSGFLTHHTNRGESDVLAEQIVADMPDVLLGGGSFHIEPLLDLSAVQLVKTDVELAAAVEDTRPLVGLFATDTLPWVADGYGSAPALSIMVGTALARLEDSPNGFFLMIEGARIDHASHGNAEDLVHSETVAFDDAIAVARDWAAAHGNATLIVTADHECGGIKVADTGVAGEIPETTWRWGQHTNADVPVFAMGEDAAVFDDARLDNRWVYAVLHAALTETELVVPDEGLIDDGYLEDIGAPVTTQVWDTDFGVGYNQLDGLRVTSDENGLWIGIDGVFEFEGDNAVIALLDLDYGDGTGIPQAGYEQGDVDGKADSLLTALQIETDSAGLGFDAAVVSIGGFEIARGDLRDDAGLRGLRDPWAYPDDDWWLLSLINFDDGNLAGDGEAATDAGATGLTENGEEIFIPWISLYDTGLPVDGLDIAISVVMTNEDGSYASNQALPPYDSDTTWGSDPIQLTSVLEIQVASDGTPMSVAVVTP